MPDSMSITPESPRSGLEFLHIGETLSFGKPPPNSLIYFGL